ncbi:hypothetical protein BGW38_006798 [Lunasporangiospora selenospora]|uniref:Uncharacterized protein n=1 Tax=Lunasporangiospora selenospora TaxID=979761 RepID=A0A9P6FYV7_9FUNG|nr:hypothetical protein BGW38_006798 [Lunasporangiospora selenospora]
MASLESTGILARAGYYHLNGSGSSHVSSSSGGSRVNRGSSNSHSSLTEGSSSNSAGIREMEYEVAFELFAGLCVSGLMCLVWLGMALRQGGNGRRGAISSVRRMSISLQRFSKQLKGGVEECKMALEAKIDALVEKIKFQID